MSPRTRSDILAASSGMVASVAAKLMLRSIESDASRECIECDCDMGPILEPNSASVGEARRVLIDALEFAIEHAREEVTPSLEDLAREVEALKTKLDKVADLAASIFDMVGE
jgi:hypothetical protein